MVTRPRTRVTLRHDNKSEPVQPARQEYMRLKRGESRKHRLSRPNSIQIEEERVPFTRFNSKETSICE